MPPTVVRRFEVYVDDATLVDQARDRLLELVAKESDVKRTSEVKAVRRLSVLEVRLEGPAPATSRIVAAVAAQSGVHIRDDALRVAAPGPFNPDPRGALLRIGVEPGSRGHGFRPGMAAVTVAVVDSGIMVDHPDLKGYLWSGKVDGVQAHGARCIGGTRSPDVADHDGHGTRLAGCILAASMGAPGVRLMAVKFFDGEVLPGPANGAAAVDFAVEQKADIIDLSWDLGMGSPALERAIANACDAGALVVIAAGNSGTDNDEIPAIPACYRAARPDRIITVMATDRYDEKASFSNYGVQTVDLAAPGVDVITTRAGITPGVLSARRHRPFNGTSAAAAEVAGAAALLKSCNPSLTADALKKCLLLSVDRIPGLKCKTEGRLNVVTAAMATC
jgi:subtilisin family serine protease